MFNNIKNCFSDFIPSIESGRLIISPIEHIACSILGILDMPHVYFHELGHVVTAKILYADVRPNIRLFITGGGASGISQGSPNIPSDLDRPSNLGRHFSPRVRCIMVNAAGPLVSVIYCVGLCMLSNRMPLDSSLCGGLLALGVGTLGGVIQYAVQGIWGDFTANNQTNDFSVLKQLGIHPIFPIFIMTALAGKLMMLPIYRIPNLKWY